MARLPRLPDLLTTANLACGVGSILLASQGHLTIACWLVFAGAVFDVFDGLVARALGGGSALGVQLDSLADMVTFGVAPGMIVWFSFAPLPKPYLDHAMILSLRLIPVFVIPVASAWRLAKFNVDTRQSSGFLGLPTPANALFWASMGLTGTMAVSRSLDPPVPAFPWTPAWVVPLASIVLGILMLSELPLPSLKFKHFRWKGNEVIYLLGGIGVVLVLLYGILAVPLILVLYLLSPLWGKAFARAGAASNHEP